MPDILIIGGGITGVTAAYELARAGLAVTLIERGKLAHMASGWTLGGVRQSGRDPAELELARAAVARWPTLDQELDGDTGYRQRGNVRLARTPEEVETIRAMVARQRGLGLDLDFLPTLADARQVAPALGEAVLAASFCPSDGHADPVPAVTSFATAAKRHGAQIREGVAATAVMTGPGGAVIGALTSEGPIHAAVTILAAGMHTPALLRPLDLHLPIDPHTVFVLRTTALPPVFEQVFGVANADCAGRQERDGSLRVTTGIGRYAEDVERWTEASLSPPAQAVADLITRVSAVLPALTEARVERLWGGLIDQTPDALPVIDNPRPGLIVAAGFSGHGFGIGPAVGEALCDLARGVPPRHQLDAFRLDRFRQARSAAPVTLHG